MMLRLKVARPTPTQSRPRSRQPRPVPLRRSALEACAAVDVLHPVAVRVGPRAEPAPRRLEAARGGRCDAAAAQGRAPRPIALPPSRRVSGAGDHLVDVPASEQPRAAGAEEVVHEPRHLQPWSEQAQGTAPAPNTVPRAGCATDAGGATMSDAVQPPKTPVGKGAGRVGNRGEDALAYAHTRQQTSHVRQESPVARLHLGCVSPESRLHLACVSAGSRLDLACISAGSRLDLGRISAGSRLGVGPATSETSTPGLAEAFAPLYEVRSKPRTAPWAAGVPWEAKSRAYDERRCAGRGERRAAWPYASHLVALESRASSRPASTKLVDEYAQCAPGSNSSFPLRT